MKIKPLFFVTALLWSVFGLAQAQTQEIFVTVKYTEQGTVKTDNFSLEGGIVQILNNTVLAIFAGNPTLNRVYQFDDINTMSFEQRNVGVSENETENFKVFFDGNTLHITAVQVVGTVSVYSVTGALVAQVESNTNTAQINLSALPKGAYMVQTGTNIVKIIK